MSEPGGQMWRSRGWWVFLGFVFSAQVAMVFWLSDHGPSVPRIARPAPVLHLWEEANHELLELRDPTLFALPRQRGFSGLAWSQRPRPTLRSPDWTEPPRWLEPKPEQLGTELAQLASPDSSGAPVTPAMPRAEVMIPDVPPGRVENASRLIIYADEPVPRLITPIPLPSWPPRTIASTEPEPLKNTVVQVVIDGEGKPRSANLLSSSGSAAADRYALEQALKARFEIEPVDPARAAALGPVLSGLRWPRLVFEWQTTVSTNQQAGP